MYFYFTPEALETPSQTGVAWGPQSNFLNCSMGKTGKQLASGHSASPRQSADHSTGLLSANGESLSVLPLSALSPGGSYGKESSCKAGDLGSIPGSGESPVEGKWQLNSSLFA